MGLDCVQGRSLLGLVSQISARLNPPSVILAVLLSYQVVVALRRRLSGWSLIHPLLTGVLLFLALLSGPAACVGFYWLIAYYFPLCLLAWAEWLIREGRRFTLIPLVSLSFALIGGPLLYHAVLGLAEAAVPSYLAITTSALGLASLSVVAMDSVLLLRGASVRVRGYVEASTAALGGGATGVTASAGEV
ncbi:MAG: hypothetical protein QI223_08885 [Candidatus Korarchaeota archaeon]|nr:hypothetical protein [Candidatus Korarchaeota archaeon]